MGGDNIHFNDTPLLKEEFSLEEMCELINQYGIGQ